MSHLVATPPARHFVAGDLSPLAIYDRLKRLSPTRFLFESVTGGAWVSRYSFLGAAPAEVYRLFADRLEVEGPTGTVVIDQRPLAALAARLARFHAAPAGDPRAERVPAPFAGGFVGWFGYDLARQTEKLGAPPPDPYGLPIAQLARYDDVIVFDHARQRLSVVVNEIGDLVPAAAAQRRLDARSDLLLGIVRVPGVAAELPAGMVEPPGLESLVPAEEYAAAVERAQDHIRAGDILQVVLARRWRLRSDLRPETLYRAVRSVNPSPYMVLLETPEAALVGASPEMLLRKQGSRLETRPIAGTRPRGATASEDRALASDLLADEKERAEHVMLVDLGRNDLGRVARAGSVRVPSFMEIERYSHVMHIVSSVEAEAAEGIDALGALLSAFPAGTVSGAPKIRAMQLVDELEWEGRGPYAGAVGYLSYGGDLDTCITIRTLVVHNGTLSVTAGAGIVADSVPEREARETESKAAGLLAAVRIAEAME